MLRLVLLVRRLAVTGCTLATCLLCFAPPLAGQGSEPKPEAKPDPGPTPWYQAVSFNGFVSVSDTHNFNRPDSRTNQFRVFDFDAGSIKLDVAELVVQKPATDRGQAGFRVDATFGSSIPRVAASAGLFRDAQGVAGDFDIHQAFASYVVQVGKGLRLDAGKFITFLGYEVIDGYDGYNENASRSFLFGYAIPFAHTGLRVTYAISSRVSGLVTVCNGWDRVRDNNTGLTFGAQLTMAPTPDLTLVMNYIGGPERADNTRDQTRVYELVGTWKAHSRVALGLDALYATEPNVSLAATVKDVRWTGVAGYAKFTATKMFSLAFRGERFNDSDGVRTGTGQRLTGLTVTPEIKTASHFVVRGDLRFDRSNAQVFERRNALVTGQNTISVNLIYYF